MEEETIVIIPGGGLKPMKPANPSPAPAVIEEGIIND